MRIFFLSSLFSGFLLFSGDPLAVAHEGGDGFSHIHPASEDCEIRGWRVDPEVDPEGGRYWMKTSASESMLPVMGRDDCFEHDTPVPGVLHPFVYRDTKDPIPTDVPAAGRLDPSRISNLYDYKGISLVRLWMNSDTSHLCVDDAYYGNWEREDYYDWPEPYGKMTAREFYEQVGLGGNTWLDEPLDLAEHYKETGKNQIMGIRVPYDGTGKPTSHLAHAGTDYPRKYAGNVFCLGDRPAIQGVVASVYMPECSGYHLNEPVDPDFRMTWDICVALANHLYPLADIPEDDSHNKISSARDFHDNWTGMDQ